MEPKPDGPTKFEIDIDFAFEDMKEGLADVFKKMQQDSAVSLGFLLNSMAEAEADAARRGRVFAEKLENTLVSTVQAPQGSTLTYAQIAEMVNPGNRGAQTFGPFTTVPVPVAVAESPWVFSGRQEFDGVTVEVRYTREWAAQFRGTFVQRRAVVLGVGFQYAAALADGRWTQLLAVSEQFVSSENVWSVAIRFGEIGREYTGAATNAGCAARGQRRITLDE